MYILLNVIRLDYVEKLGCKKIKGSLSPPLLNFEWFNNKQVKYAPIFHLLLVVDYLLLVFYQAT